MQRSTFVVTLISAVIAAIVSLGTAYWTSRSTVNLEMDKVVVAAQQRALQLIIQARLQVYSEAYQLMSQLLKDASEKRIDREYLERLRSAFDAWDSKNAYLLGPESVNIAHEFRQQLLCNLEESKHKECNQETLLQHAAWFELALKSDLGIYGIKLQGPDPGLVLPPVPRY